MLRILAILTTLAMPVAADTPMTAAEFGAYVKGRTLSFATAGNPPYGIEQYLPNRKVIWKPVEGECVNGVWYEQAGDICFLYDHDPEPKCWTTYRTKSGIRAEFTTRPGVGAIFENVEDVEPLTCPGPDLLSKR